MGVDPRPWVPLLAGRELVPWQLHPGESLCPWGDPEGLLPQGILSRGFPEPPCRGKALMANGLATSPTPPSKASSWAQP